MKYWKKIKLSNLDIIQKKAHDFFQSEKEKLGDNHMALKTMVPVFLFDHANFRQMCPEIDQAFSELGFNIKFIIAYIMFSDYEGAIHIDSGSDRARVNIPILNCNDSKTGFYDNVKLNQEIFPNGAVFYSVSNLDYTLVDEVTVDEPTVLRISKPHGIKLGASQEVPRITLSVGLDPDPVILLDQDDS